MNRERFVELASTKTFKQDDLAELDGLIKEYPYFSLPKFLRMKAAFQLGVELEKSEINTSVIYTSDRKYLYHWIRGEEEGADSVQVLKKNELEFIDDGAALPDDSFELMDEGLDRELDEADIRAIPEKHDVDLEDPEIEESLALPVIDNLEDVEDMADDESEEIPSEEEQVSAESQAENISSEVITDNKEDRQTRPISQQELLQSAGSGKGSGRQNQSVELIEQFLQKDPGVIKADKVSMLEGDVSVDSVVEDDSYITDTLAKIYVKQGLHAKAIYAYERLSLKYPEKSAYFAAQIEKIKNNSNV